MSEQQEPQLSDDHIVVGAMVESLQDCPHYTFADRVVGLIVIEADKDDQGRLHGFMVLGDRSQEVMIDLSRLHEGAGGEGNVSVEAA